MPLRMDAPGDGLPPAHEMGLALALLRTVKGWTQTELAAAAGTQASSISSYERCQKLPSLKSLVKVLEVMGYPLAALELTHFYVQALHQGVGMAPLPALPSALVPSASTSDAALSWELENAAPDLGRAVARYAKLALLLLRDPGQDARGESSEMAREAGDLGSLRGPRGPASDGGEDGAGRDSEASGAGERRSDDTSLASRHP